MDLNRVMVTGAQGMIGRAMPWGIKLARSDLDVTNSNQIASVFDAIRPSAVVHLAAMDIRQCQTDPLTGYNVNTVGTYHVAVCARRASIPLLFVSTGAVFSGPLGSRFDESAAPCPVNFYGQSKLLAELLVRKTLGCEHLIVRTGWVYGADGPHQRKFVNIAIDKALRGEPIQGSKDQEGSAIYVKDLVAQIAGFLQSEARGTYHVVNDGVVTGFSLARWIVQAVKSKSQVEGFDARQSSGNSIGRSPSEVLVSQKLRLRSWHEAINEYIATVCGGKAGLAASDF